MDLLCRRKSLFCNVKHRDDVLLACVSSKNLGFFCLLFPLSLQRIEGTRPENSFQPTFFLATIIGGGSIINSL